MTKGQRNYIVARMEVAAAWGVGVLTDSSVVRGICLVVFVFCAVQALVAAERIKLEGAERAP